MKLTRKRKDGLKRQAEIMTIALELFAQKGYHSTKLEDILKKAKIAKGTFYLHFKSKDDLLNMIVDTHLEELYKTLSILDISIDKPIDEIIDLYRTISKTLVNDKQFRYFARIMLKDAIGLNTTLLQKLNDFYNKIIDMSTDYILNAQNKGRLVNTINPHFTAMCIVGSVKELVFQWAINDERLDIENAIMTAADIYFRGMVN